MAAGELDARRKHRSPARPRQITENSTSEGRIHREGERGASR